MKTMKVLAICAIAMLSVTSAKAQFTTGADVVSSYIWRGIPQDATLGGNPNIQPSLSYTIGGLSIGSWASGSFIGTVKEVDLYATYTITPAFAITLTDYNYNFSAQPKYFDYSAATGHIAEATVTYTGAAFSGSINTMLAGADKKPSDATKNAFSTYAEVGYQISPAAKAFVGCSLMESASYGTTGFGVTNLGLKVSKSIVISDKFSLPVYGIVGANPYSQNAFFVAGVTL